MNMTLRKIHAVLKQLAASVATVREVTAEVYSEATAESVTATMLDVDATNIEQYRKTLSLIEMLAKLRSSVQHLNARKMTVLGTEVSINELLNKKAELENVLRITSAFAGTTEFSTDESSVTRVLAQIKENERGYGVSRTNTPTLTKISKLELREVHYKAKRELEVVTDKLSVLNNSISIELSADEVKALTELRII